MADMKDSKKNVAFITGITGQDGSYLTEILLEKNYEVHGLVRPSSYRRQSLNHALRPGITLHVGDITDSGRLLQILGNIEVDEVYHLAAQSHVGVSFESPLSTCDINALGSLRLLEAILILQLHKKIRFYSAVTSELFGNNVPAPQTENTPFHPVSPYALAKQFQYGITVNFRDAYGFHASNGILFNHESPRRGTNFVTRKITTQVALIACGKSEEFELGNLNATRDWGHARDYMEGVWLMLQQPTGGDFVLATGRAVNIRQFVEAAFEVIGTKIEWTGSGVDEIGREAGTGKVRVRVNPKYYRPVENENLLGSAAKAKKILGWEPRHTLRSLVEEMVKADIDLVKKEKIFTDTLLDWLVLPKEGAETEIHNNDQADSASRVEGKPLLGDEATKHLDPSSNGHSATQPDTAVKSEPIVPRSINGAGSNQSYRLAGKEHTTRVFEAIKDTSDAKYPSAMFTADKNSDLSEHNNAYQNAATKTKEQGQYVYRELVV